MKKKLLLALAGLFCLSTLHSQGVVKWNFSAKKIADKTYELHLTATVQGPWHIYSQTTPEGGPLPTSVNFNKNPLIRLEGTVREEGNLQKKYEEVFGLDVKYFNGNVDFVQTLSLTAKARTNISGTVEFMVCNDTQCLPPKTINFSIPLQ